MFLEKIVKIIFYIGFNKKKFLAKLSKENQISTLSINKIQLSNPSVSTKRNLKMFLDTLIVSRYTYQIPIPTLFQVAVENKYGETPLAKMSKEAAQSLHGTY